MNTWTLHNQQRSGTIWCKDSIKQHQRLACQCWREHSWNTGELCKMEFDCVQIVSATICAEIRRLASGGIRFCWFSWRGKVRLSWGSGIHLAKNALTHFHADSWNEKISDTLPMSRALRLGGGAGGGADGSAQTPESIQIWKTETRDLKRYISSI